MFGLIFQNLQFFAKISYVEITNKVISSTCTSYFSLKQDITHLRNLLGLVQNRKLAVFSLVENTIMSFFFLELLQIIGRKIESTCDIFLLTFYGIIISFRYF